MTDPLTFDRSQRWRLILGKRVEQSLARSGGSALSNEMREIDDALGAIYDPSEEQPDQSAPRKRSAGLGASAPRIARWLGDVRKYFEQDVVVMIQHDAIERKGLKELLFEPETLAQVTPSVDLVATLLSLKNLIPDKARHVAREIVAAVVAEIVKRMAPAIEKAVRGALNRSTHQPLPSLPNMDWKRTIRLNLKNYVPAHRTIVPERFYFFSRQQRRKEYNVVVCMDQSGSMAESVVYGSIMGSIFASIPAIESHMVVFDTEVVDLTAALSDPVDLLFGVQLGGGTDINRAVSYCETLVHDPRKTLFILITDLYEGGNEHQLVARMGALVGSGVRAVTLLALSDSGIPSYDESLAQRLAAVGVPCFACTPNRLPDVLEQMLKGADLGSLARKFDTRNVTPTR